MAFVRSIGRGTMTAMVINCLIGAGIFGLPSEISRLVGRASPLAMLAAALIMSVIVACMAEVASQFTEPGGGYLYVRTAFGRFAGLQVGWFWLLASMAGAAGCANLFVQYLAGIWPAAAQNWARVAIIIFLIAIPTAANYLGVRSGANLSTILTIAKLLPLFFLIVVGVAYFLRHPQTMSVTEITQPTARAWLSALLLLIFPYSGSENSLAPAGEIKDPRKTPPFGLLVGLAIVAAVYALIQFVTVATIGTKVSDHPLADAAAVLLGPGGSLFVALAVMISTYGYISVDVLTTPRIVYSFASHGDAPDFLARLHPRYSTPAVALVVCVALEALLAVTGTFLWLAGVIGASTLIFYCGVCASLIRLRKIRPEAPALRIPFGSVLAVVAIGISLALVSAMEWSQTLLIGMTALLATANWWWAKWQERSRVAAALPVASPR